MVKGSLELLNSIVSGRVLRTSLRAGGRGAVWNSKEWFMKGCLSEGVWTANELCLACSGRGAGRGVKSNWVVLESMC